MLSSRTIYDSGKFDYFVWVVFLVIGLLGLINHEIWLDEAHHWLVIRDVENFSEFITVESVDDQPFIWPILIYCIRFFSDDIIAFQLFHFCIGAVSALLFVRHAPFNKNIKYLFIFSYSMLYEYLIISRNYSLSVLLIVIFLIYFRKKGMLTKAIVLGVLANTHFFAAILASIILIYELNPRIRDVSVFNKRKVLAYMIFSGFIILLFLQLWNSLDHAVMTQYNTWTFFERLKRMVSLHFRSFIMIPDFSSVHFWGGVLPFKISKAFGLLAIPMFLFPVLLLQTRKVRWAYYLTTIAISIFLFSIHQPIAARYSCFIFICFITFYWLQKEDLIDEVNRVTKYSQYLLSALLFIQMLSGITSVFFEYKYPFSQGKNVAEYIEQNGYIDWPIIIHPYSASPAVSAYLGKPYYSLVTKSMASFCRWETNPFRSIVF